MRLAEPEAIARHWPPAEVERTFELPDADGEPMFTIDRHSHAGHRIRITGLGECLITTDGRQIAYAAIADATLRWRLLFGQGLPIAAALAGLEVLHASAVVREGRALAISGPSGAGKTATALHLMTHGAEFLADDVVAIEEHGDALVAHSGLGVAHVSGTERAALEAAGVAPPASFDGGAKHHVALAVRERHVQLGAMYSSTGAPTCRAPPSSPCHPPTRACSWAQPSSPTCRPPRASSPSWTSARDWPPTVPTFRVDVPRDSSAATIAALIAAQSGADR